MYKISIVTHEIYDHQFVSDCINVGQHSSINNKICLTPKTEKLKHTWLQKINKQCFWDRERELYEDLNFARIPRSSQFISFRPSHRKFAVQCPPDGVWSGNQEKRLASISSDGAQWGISAIKRLNKHVQWNSFHNKLCVIMKRA